MCHFPLERPLLVHSICFIKGDTVFFRCLFPWPPFLLLPFLTRSVFWLLWTSYSLPLVCSAIVNHNQWREELSQSWLRWMTWVLLSLWKPSFREIHAESTAPDSVGCSLPCQSVPTLISWHSEKIEVLCCLNMMLLWPLNSSCRIHFSFSCLCTQSHTHRVRCIPSYRHFSLAALKLPIPGSSFAKSS